MEIKNDTLEVGRRFQVFSINFYATEKIRRRLLDSENAAVSSLQTIISHLLVRHVKINECVCVSLFHQLSSRREGGLCDVSSWKEDFGCSRIECTEKNLV